VIHRVKNKKPVVMARSVGSGFPAWKKSRQWSIAMISITNPRKISMDAIRCFGPGSFKTTVWGGGEIAAVVMIVSGVD
jgi:hypothetical protein